MVMYNRRSPVKYPSLPRKKEIRDGWEVVLEYRDQGTGPFLIDLSHIPKWDVQDARLSNVESWGELIPVLPGGCTVQNGTLVSRMNPTQAVIWHLLQADPVMPQYPAFTDVTDACALMAVLAKDVFAIMEKVTPLDLSTPSKKPPFLLQGPVLRVRCQIVLLDRKGEYMAVLIACSRGFGQSMTEALLDAAKEWDLRPGGETVFRDWLKEE
ncbi:MAG: hypothetical protein AMK69_21680 [Nitrospira bacterium SG8_3]|nr:MAG: hypothetical protein AMK69_21680 [Nitrospira bacterium SG8_3]